MKQYGKFIKAFVLASTLFLIASPFSMSLSAQTYKISTVRGKIERKGDYKIHSAAYVRVTLATPAKRTKRITVYTGSDGMYYFRNVARGTYVLEVWNAEGKAIGKYSIKADREYVDIAPIKID